MPMQLYPFGGLGVEADTTYTQVNLFLVRLGQQGVVVTPEDIHEETKNYVSDGRSVTRITVMPQITTFTDTQETLLAEIQKIYQEIRYPKPSVNENESEDVQAARKLLAGKNLELSFIEGEGWMLARPGCRPDEVAENCFWGVPEKDVLTYVKRHLGMLPQNDDFDPFLDADDLP
jgi:hypothetical protein